jgi:tRNA(fMet)-specific endonuclease VapC
VSGEVLLDTNVVIALFAGEASVLKELDGTTGVSVPSVVLGELFYGAYNSAAAEENTDRVREFAANVTVLVCDAVTAERYGRVKADLRALGQPIPENDVWIAALARQHDMTLVSRDAHFASVPGLRTEQW